MFLHLLTDIAGIQLINGVLQGLTEHFASDYVYAYNQEQVKDFGVEKQYCYPITVDMTKFRVEMPNHKDVNSIVKVFLK